MEILQLTGSEFLARYLPMMGIAAVLAMGLLYFLRPAGSRWQPNDPYDVAFIRGGNRGVLEAATAKLLHTRALRLDGNQYNTALYATEGAASNHPVEQALLRLTSTGNGAAAAGEAAVKSAMASRKETLVERGVLMGESARWLNYLLAMAPLAAVLSLGMMKIDIGLSRGRPVGFLVMLVLAGALVLAAGAALRPKLTRAGRRSFDQWQDENAPLRLAGTGGSLGHLDSRDILMSVALFGMAPLIGTELGPVQHYFKPAQASTGSSCSGSSCSTSSCGSSCGGGCGGGCGGCGS